MKKEAESDRNYRSAGNGILETCSSPSQERQEPQKVKNLLTCFSFRRNMTAFSVLFFVLIGLLILLAFTIRCEESKLITCCEDKTTSLETAYTHFSTMWEKQVKEREDIYKSRKIEWTQVKQFSKELFEPAGHERGDLLLYVARTSHKNGTVIGKLLHSAMYYGYDGEEFFTQSKVEILLYPHGTVNWIPRGKGEGLPPEDSLVFGGADPDTGENMYICRIKTDDHLIIGSILRSSLGCIAHLGRKYVNDT